MQLLKKMQEGDKSWSLYVFSSVNAIRKYSVEELVQLGVSWIWLGLESPNSAYAKLQDSDTLKLAAELRLHGIKLLGSTIIGLEHHTPENLRDEIDHAVAHCTDFRQFILYTPVPGTPLFRQMTDENRMLGGVDLADIHGQFKFNFEHTAISREQSKQFLDWAFRRDLARNGPSLFRICETIFHGWRRYHDHADPRVRRRIAFDAAKLRTTYNAALWAMTKRLQQVSPEIAMKIDSLRCAVENEFGWATRAVRAVVGPLLFWTSRREDQRLQRGFTHEPKTFVERRNWKSSIGSASVASKPLLEPIREAVAAHAAAVATTTMR